MSFVIYPDPLYHNVFKPDNLTTSEHTSQHATWQTHYTCTYLYCVCYMSIIFIIVFTCISWFVLLYHVRHRIAWYVFQSRQRHQRGKTRLHTYDSRPSVNSLKYMEYTVCLEITIFYSLLWYAPCLRTVHIKVKIRRVEMRYNIIRSER